MESSVKEGQPHSAAEEAQLPHQPESTRSALACCSLRAKEPKPMSQRAKVVTEDGKADVDEKGQKRVIWDTADLMWWDFYRRRWSTLWLMRTVYTRYKNVQEQTEGLEEGPERDKIWQECHAISAVELKRHAEEAKGLFIKAGQAMSSMVGTLPDAFTKEFLSLTDHLPVSTIEEVYRIIQRTFHQAPKDIFCEFDPEPLASASIAQVHKARLLSTKEIVAVKVQHDGVDRIFLEDINTLTAVANQVADWWPDLDFRKFAEEWRESLPRELDFFNERSALERARKALKEAGNTCIVPRVHPDLCGTHVFVMEFIESGPILDLGNAKFCEENGVDKQKVVRELLEAFGIMAFRDGMFHADPHAGNVRLKLDPSAPGGASPVLLDWGLIREITDEERLGLAKVFHSLANFDIAGLFDVLQMLGFSLKTELMTDSFKSFLMEKFRGVVKDTINKQRTRENAKEEMAEYRARLEEKQEGAMGSASPLYFLEEWPRCVIFFLRMLQIVRGLCISVDAEGVPFLQIFADHARDALRDGSQKQLLSSHLRIFAGREGRKRPDETPFTPKAAVKRNSVLEARVQKTLADLQSRKQIVGAQVAVVVAGEVVCSVSAGTLSTIDARAVEESTRFPLLGATAGVGALALLRALHRQSKDLISSIGDTSITLENLLHKLLVSQIWPNFGAGDERLSLANLLSHCAGLQDAYPAEFTQSALDDCAAMVRHFEDEHPKLCAEPRYAYLLQSFVMAKLGSCIGGQDDFLHWLGQELGPLGLDVALPAGRGREASVSRDLPQLARVSMQEVQGARAKRKQKDKQVKEPALVSEDSRDGVDGGSSCSSARAQVRARNLLQAIAAEPAVFDPLQANATAGGLFRGGLSMSASARGLAEMLGNEELTSQLQQLKALTLEGVDKTAIGWVLAGGATQWTAGGLQALDLRGTGHRALRTYPQSGYGVVCGLGPAVAHFPDLAPGGVTVAVLVNDVLHGRQASGELMAAALKDFGVAPSWPDLTLSVLADAHNMAKSKDAEPLLESVGGMEGLRGLLNLSMDEKSQAKGLCGGCTTACFQVGQCCASLCGSGK